MPQSPTANLPNLVADGTSPRGPLNKGRKPKPGSNWLTAYAKEKKLGKEGSLKMKEAISGLPSSSGFSKIKPQKKSKKKKDVQLKLKP